MVRKRGASILAIVAVVVAFAGGSAWGANPFTDINGNTHANNIDAIYNAGITAGCSQGPTFYCPGDNVTRAQMASFLARTAGLSSGSSKNFPVANARSATQTFCALVANNPQTFADAPCADTSVSIDPDTFVNGAMDLAIGIDGFAVMSYWNSSQNELKFAHCHNAACTSADVRIIDPGEASAGSSNAIAIGSDGMPVIAYNFGQDLRVAHCNDPTCATAALTTIDSVGTFSDVSIAIRLNGLPIITYYDQSPSAIKVARCNNVTCSNNTRTVLADEAEDFLDNGDIAVRRNGLPIAVYTNSTDRDLIVATCSDSLCTSSLKWAYDTAGDVGVSPSVAIGSDGLAVISFWDRGNGDLKFVRCTEEDCSTWSTPINLTNSINDDGSSSSIAIGTDGLPLISYYDASEADLKLMRCRNLACTTRDSVTVASGNQVGAPNAIGVGPDGVPVIAHRNHTDSRIIVSRPRTS